MENTKIEWCDHSWSPWRGCTKVSPGCANCYAETLSHRNPAVLGQWGTGKPRVKAKNWNEPRKWNRAEAGKMVSHAEFVVGRKLTVFPSLCDWLDDEVPIEWLAEFLQLVHATPDLTWLLLTKRPENWADRVEEAMLNLSTKCGGSDPKRMSTDAYSTLWSWVRQGDAPANVWLGTSVEDQQRADERIPALLRIPARGRFLSLEPLLGDVDVSFGLPVYDIKMGRDLVRDGVDIDWLIIGGESGNGSRPCSVEWIRSLVRQGQAAGVPTFVKQLGARPVEDIHDARGHYLGFQRLDGITHPKGGDPAEWPDDLRVRQFPTITNQNR